MLSPKNKITPRFDSYETLPKQGVTYPMTSVQSPTIDQARLNKS